MSHVCLLLQPALRTNEDGATDGSCAPRWPRRAAGGCDRAPPADTKYVSMKIRKRPLSAEQTGRRGLWGRRPRGKGSPQSPPAGVLLLQLPNALLACRCAASPACLNE